MTYTFHMDDGRELIGANSRIRMPACLIAPRSASWPPWTLFIPPTPVWPLPEHTKPLVMHTVPRVYQPSAHKRGLAIDAYLQFADHLLSTKSNPDPEFQKMLPRRCSTTISARKTFSSNWTSRHESPPSSTCRDFLVLLMREEIGSSAMPKGRTTALV
ncbi:hypothetical protein VTI74DRAFT_4252 [Chaetomium olivicolor]